MWTLVLAGICTAIAAAPIARTIALTGTEHMRFDKHDVTVKAGETVHIMVKAVGVMPKPAMAHNFVLVKPDTDLDRFNAAAFNSRDSDYIPPEMAGAVVAHTELAGAGETVEVTFTAPDKPGRYPYFCSFPGHFARGMRGVLVVK